MTAPDPMPDANVRSPTYSIAFATAPCPRCGMSTRLLALAMPSTHETLNLDASDEDVDARDAPSRDSWQPARANAFLFYVQQICDGVEHRLRQFSGRFSLARSSATQQTYWANHCEHCGALIDDHELHCEPDGAFSPSSEAAAATIELIHIDAPLLAVAAGYAPEPEFLRFMRRL